MLRIFTLTVVISSSICLMLWTTKSLFLIFLKAGLVCCTYGTSLTSSRHSSSSSSGIGRSIRSESSSSSRDDAFSEGAYHCPRISGYYFGTGVLLGCRMVFRKRTLSSVGIGSWHCLKKDLGIPAKWEYDDVVVSTPTLGSSNDEDYVDWTEFNNGWEGSTHLAMHKDCHAIMVISHSSGFYIFHWGQHVEGKTSTSNDDGLFIRTVGYYFGQGEYQGCRIKVRVGLSMINTLSMTCPPHKDVSEPFSGKLTCWPLTSRAPSSDRLFDPFTAHKYSKIGLSHFGTDNDVHDYSIAVSDNALFLKLRDNASGKDTLFEWERFDLGILETPAIYPHPRTYGYYFGQEGQYQKCYFQFRDAGIKFVSMHCPRGKTLLPTALTGKRLMYGVEAYGDDPQYYKLALLTSNGDKDVFSLTLLLKHDSTMLRLSYYGYDEPFYFPWAPSIGEEGQPVGMPAPRENGYYSRDKKGRDVIRFHNGQLSIRCERVGCNANGLERASYYYRVIMESAEKESEIPEYLKLELIDSRSGQPSLVGIPELSLRKDGEVVKVKMLDDDEEVLFMWVVAQDDEEAIEQGDTVDGGLLGGSSNKISINTLKKAAKKKFRGGLSFKFGRKEKKENI